MFLCRWIYAPILLLFVCAPPLVADTLPPDACEHLPPHPRLYANAARWNALRGQVHADPASARLYAAVLHEADNLLPRPVLAYPADRKEFLAVVRDGRERIITLAAVDFGDRTPAQMAARFAVSLGRVESCQASGGVPGTSNPSAIAVEPSAAWMSAPWNRAAPRWPLNPTSPGRNCACVAKHGCA